MRKKILKNIVFLLCIITFCLTITSISSINVKADTSLTPIMGQGTLNKNQMINSLINRNNKLTVREICDFVDNTIKEANIEGVNYDILFSQMMLETNYLNYGGDVQASQNNFAGLGATGGGNPGHSFESVQIGIRAVVQHLKAYASTEALKQSCVDPRFQYVKRGTAIYVEYLGQKENPTGAGWATAEGYGQSILNILNSVGKYSAKQNYSLVSLFNVTGNKVTGSTLSIDVGSDNSSDTLYRIAAVDRNTEEWRILSEWSSKSTATYTPINPGTHRIVVYTKNKNKIGNEADDYKYIDLNIVSAKVKINNLAVSGNRYVQSQLTIKASATPSSESYYKIMVVDRNTEKWETLSDWSTNNTINYTPVNPGTHRVVVYVKNKDVIGDVFDEYKYEDIQVGAPTSKVDVLNVSGDANKNSILNIKTEATPSSSSYYKIMAVDRSTEKWVTLSDWSTRNSIEYTPLNVGIHRIVVYVKDKSVGGDVYSDYKYVDLNVGPEVTKVNTLSITGKAYINNELTITSSATPSNSIYYKIMAVDRNTEKWVTLSDWSTNNTVKYKPLSPGTHRIVVYIKKKDVIGNDDSIYKYMDINVDGPISKVSSLNVTGDYMANSVLKINATANPSDSTYYKIMAVDRSTEKWVTLSDWSTKNTIEYIPLNAGTHRVVVYVKDKSVIGDIYTDYKYIDLQVVQVKSKITSLNITGESYAKYSLKINTTASPSDSTYYKIMAVDRKTEKWITLSDWSAVNSVNYVPENSGIHRIVVYVKHKTAYGNKEDDYKYIDLDIKPSVSKVTSLDILGSISKGETVTIKATANPSNNAYYKIMAVDRSTEQWTTLSNWSHNNEVSYTFTNNANYRFVVYVKDKNKSGDKEDDYKYIDVSTYKGKIVIDPGHGGSDPGASGNGYIEKNGTLTISLKLKNKLETMGYEVYITRSNDTYVDLYDRARLANNIKADLLISVHHNSFNSTSTGIEVLYSSNQMDSTIRNEAINSGWTDPNSTYSSRLSTSKALANELSSSLATNLGMINRGGKDQNLAVCRNTAMPSILVEAGFISNPNDCNKVMSNSGQQVIVDTIANIVSKYI